MEPLTDSWGREIKSVRVSVTDKCNFRCTYCMPAEGLEWLAKAFGLRERTGARFTGEDGRITHAEMELEDGVIMLANTVDGNFPVAGS